MDIEYVPVKHKRRSKRNASLWENDNATFDTVTHVEVDVMTNIEEQEQVQFTSAIQDYPNVAPECDMEEPHMVAEPTLGAEPTWPHVGKVNF